MAQAASWGWWELGSEIMGVDCRVTPAIVGSLACPLSELGDPGGSEWGRAMICLVLTASL